MNKLKSYLLFSREHRSGIFLLVVIIIVLQFGIYYFDKLFFSNPEKLSVADVEWLNAQKEIDSLKNVSIDNRIKLYPFNPNYITDYKGYVLGMSNAEIDRLLQYRAQGKFVNSSNEFQAVTQISDSLLDAISPYFKFPDWVTKKNAAIYEKKVFVSKEKVILKPIDINMATKEDLMRVYGIGDKISDIILQEKEKFGAFVSMEQLQYVWGVSPEVYKQMQQLFFVGDTPNVVKIKINELSTRELAKFPYFKYALAKEIVTYRSMNGGIQSVEDLTKIKDFPVDKIKIIALYLEIH
ncbi:helix-hairpin-helix domain-containing protein [Flavobacterium chuncheonense]|uniref:Helix-hairpin-helix domain-containing protein n=1 Tax=Flavobacterium chuncheonense TaxID=2026653 RepID=A0ABW5YKS9_9FLAO